MASSGSKIAKRFHLPARLAEQLATAAKQQRRKESHIAEEALEAYFNPAEPDFIQLENTMAVTLRKQTRAIQSMQRDINLGVETLAQFVRVYFGNTFPPNHEMREEILKGAPKRWEAFTDAVRQQIVKDVPYVREILEDEQ
ncbi:MULTISPECIES: hypothetical protein [Pseudomonadota]|jgi:predicted DNA-binding protein|uniref:hypothetical protein n=1 Tax=Pseudomonadota TaxID=1224 RepID=UPI001869088D|nr:MULTISPECIES: hypothetical protein [Pseudomonadota]